MNNLRDMLVAAKRDMKTVVGVGVYDAGSAKRLDQTVKRLEAQRRIPEQIQGFVTFVSGYLTSVTQLGEPDMAVINSSDVEQQVRRIKAVAPNLPIGVDIDTGFHNEAYSILRVAMMMHAAGANYVQIEDQDGDKTCGHKEGALGTGKLVIDPYEFAAVKLRPIAEYARATSDFMLMARTDALNVNGLDDALERGALYHTHGGAEMIFVESPTSYQQMEAIAKRFKQDDMEKAFALINFIEGSPKTPYYTAPTAAVTGFPFALYCIGSVFASHLKGAKGLDEYFEAIVTGKDPVHEGILPVDSFAQFNKFIGRAEIEETNKKYRRLEQKMRDGSGRFDFGKN